MRTFFFIYTFLMLPAYGWTQLKIEKPKESLYFYTNMSYGSATNRGSVADLSIKSNGDSRINKLLSIDRSAPMWNLMVGAKYKRHAVELGYGMIAHHSGGEYIVESAPEKLPSAFSTVRSMNYVPLRYYYRAFNWGAKMSVELGAGVSFASFPDDGRDWVSEPRERNYVEYFPDGKTFSITELTDEEQIHRSALNYELNARLNWQIGKRLGFNCAYNYIYSPKIIRKTDFSIIPQIGKTHSGTINSSLTSSVASLGFNYYISSPPFQKQKQDEKEEEDEEKSKNYFYISSDVGIFYNQGNFKGGVSSGILEQNIWPTSTRHNLALNIGYDMSKYAVELSYQKLHNFNDFIYEEWKPAPEINALKLARDDSGVSSNYFAARLYRNFIHKSNNWRLNVGTGIALAQFSKSDASKDFQAKSTSHQSLKYDPDPSVNLLIDYTDFEKLREQTWCLEGNLKAERLLSNRWRINFWTRYIYNPQAVRTVKFDISTNKGQKRSGETSTSLSSFGMGVGLKYTLQ